MHTREQKQEIRTILQGASLEIMPAGSQHTCNPPPDMANSDIDWIVLTWTNPDEHLRAAGFTQLGEPEFYTGNDAGGFRSWRRGDINLIITQDVGFYRKFRTATELARRFNLLEKHDRIALFQVILYGVEIGSLEPEPYEPTTLSASSDRQIPIAQTA